jgi:hypothetical protein
MWIRPTLLLAILAQLWRSSWAVGSTVSLLLAKVAGSGEFALDSRIGALGLGMSAQNISESKLREGGEGEENLTLLHHS